MTPAPVSRVQGQRGVALVTAILIVALATILATQIGFDSALEQRRTSAILSLDQAYLIGLGAEAWAASYLKKDLDDGSKQDYPAERWATPIPPIPVEGGEVEGFVEDLQGRFNLNNLVTAEGAQNPEAMRQFPIRSQLRMVRRTTSTRRRLHRIAQRTARSPVSANCWRCLISVSSATRSSSPTSPPCRSEPRSISALHPAS
jgi:type II secretory pathway component PulK